jgi:hypothetical protein
MCRCRLETRAALCCCANSGSSPSDQKSANMILTSAESLRDEHVSKRVLADDKEFKVVASVCEGSVTNELMAKKGLLADPRVTSQETVVSRTSDTELKEYSVSPANSNQ